MPALRGAETETDLVQIADPDAAEFSCQLIWIQTTAI